MRKSEIMTIGSRIGFMNHHMKTQNIASAGYQTLVGQHAGHPSRVLRTTLDGSPPTQMTSVDFYGFPAATFI